MRVLSIIAACAVLVAARAAAADGTGIIVAAGDEDGGRALAAALSAAITEVPDGAHPPIVVGDAIARARAAVAAGAVPAATLQQFRRVRDQIDEGWDAYHRVAIDLARSRLAVARTDAEALVALPGGAELYADASLRLGAVLAHLGRHDDARAAIALALALDPDRPITYAEFSPELFEDVDAVRAAAPPKRAVAIASEPPGALISVDRADLGASPLDAQLTRGQHVIIARAPLHRPAARAIAVDDGAAPMPAIDLALDDDIAAVRLAAGAQLGLDAAGAQELVDAALQFGELDDAAIAITTERRGGPALLLQRCAGAPARCTAVVEIGYGDPAGLRAAARSAWQAALAGELRDPPRVFGDRRVAGGGDEHRCRECRSPWLWSGVGAAVIGTIVLIVVESASKPAPIVGIDPSAFGRH